LLRCTRKVNPLIEEREPQHPAFFPVRGSLRANPPHSTHDSMKSPG